MKDVFKKISYNTLCPCGSGKKYGECCRKKKFKFGIVGDKLMKRQKITSNILVGFDELNNLFEELYGRAPKNNEKVFTFAEINNNEPLNKLVYTLRKAGIPENEIYATYKMDGLMPNEYNKQYIADIELEQFHSYVEEYDKFINASLNEGHINILQYVMFVNDIGFNVLSNSTSKLICSLNDFINRHSKSNSRIEFKKGSLMEYLMFIVLKTIKTLKGIEVLTDNNMNENSYIVGRSLFESYMYLNAINQDNNFFNNYISPIIDTDNYQSITDSSGKVSKEKYINKNTGDVVNTYLKTFSLSKYFKCKEDKEIYNLFYASSSHFVHSDIKSADTYFKKFDIYEEFDPNLKAGLITISLVCLILRQIILIDEVQSQYKKDVSYLLNNIETDLIKCFEMFNADEEQYDEIFNVYISRLKK